MTEFRVDQLRYDVERQTKEHGNAISRTRDGMLSLKVRMQAIQEMRRTRRKKRAEAPPAPPDDTCMRRLVWRIEKISEILSSTPQGQSIWSEEYSVLGLQGFQLEFFPNGRESTSVQDFCSVFLWCPGGLELRYQLQVGGRVAAPDEDSYPSRMGHGHSSFCHLMSERDGDTDSVEVSATILSARHCNPLAGGIKAFADCPEVHIQREAEILHHRDMDSVEWRIKDVSRKAECIPKGCAICSPLFSVVGVRHMLLEFYPQGLQATSEDGFCGLYLRAPPGTSLVVSLLIGSTEKGPLKAEFEGHAAKGVPSFCRLANATVDGDVVIGLKVKNVKAEEKENLHVLEFSS